MRMVSIVQRASARAADYQYYKSQTQLSVWANAHSCTRSEFMNIRAPARMDQLNSLHVHRVHVQRLQAPGPVAAAHCLPAKVTSHKCTAQVLPSRVAELQIHF